MGRGLFPSGMNQMPFAAANQFGGRRSGGTRRRRKGKKTKTARRKKTARKSTGRKMKFGSPAWQKKYKVGKYKK